MQSQFVNSENKKNDKERCHKTKLTNLRNKQGNFITEKEEMVEVIQQIYKELYTSKPNKKKRIVLKVVSEKV